MNYKKLTTILLTLNINCATIQHTFFGRDALQDTVDMIEDKGGCYGIGHTNIKNHYNLAKSYATQSSKNDYLQRCSWDQNAQGNSITVFDEESGFAITYSSYYNETN